MSLCCLNKNVPWNVCRIARYVQKKRASKKTVKRAGSQKQGDRQTAKEREIGHIFNLRELRWIHLAQHIFPHGLLLLT